MWDTTTTMKLPGLSLGAFILLASCSGSQLKARAAQDFNCSADQIEIAGLDNYLERATGCGKSGVYAKATDDSWVSALESAAFALDCPRNQLTETSLGGSKVGISGCGKKAVYIAVPKVVGGMTVSWEWIMDSATNKSGEVGD